MNPTDEKLLHDFYAGDTAALDRIVKRHESVLSQVVVLFLTARTGSPVQARSEWDIGERLENVWAYILMSRKAAFGS